MLIEATFRSSSSYCLYNNNKVMLLRTVYNSSKSKSVIAGDLLGWASWVLHSLQSAFSPPIQHNSQFFLSSLNETRRENVPIDFFLHKVNTVVKTSKWLFSPIPFNGVPKKGFLLYLHFDSHFCLLCKGRTCMQKCIWERKFIHF